ncbi:hypothetical protein [Streptomyces sp. NPDC001508]
MERWTAAAEERERSQVLRESPAEFRAVAAAGGADPALRQGPAAR